MISWRVSLLYIQGFSFSIFSCWLSSVLDFSEFTLSAGHLDHQGMGLTPLFFLLKEIDGLESQVASPEIWLRSLKLFSNWMYVRKRLEITIWNEDSCLVITVILGVCTLFFFLGNCPHRALVKSLTFSSCSQ